MTTRMEPTTTPRAGDDDDLAAALTRVLGTDFMPARGDQLLAALASQHAPGQVMWLLADLPTNREFVTFAEVATVCGSGTTTSECPRWYA